MKPKRFFFAVFFLCAGGPALLQAQDATAYCQAANGLYAAKNYSQALRYYDAAVQTDPNMWQAYQGLGNCYYALGDKAKAVSNYQRCLSLNRDNPQLSAFVDSLRAQMKAEESAPKEKYSAAETKRILRTASGESGAYFEAGPSAGVAQESYFGLGPGAGGNAFYFFDPYFGIGGMVHLYFFGTAFTQSGIYTTQSLTQGTYTQKISEGLSCLEIVPCLKYKFEGGNFKPYLVGGLGLTFLSASYSTSTNYQNGTPYNYQYYSSPGISRTQIDPTLIAGIGLEYALERETKIFLEARFDDISDKYRSESYIPIEGGVNFQL